MGIGTCTWCQIAYYLAKGIHVLVIKMRSPLIAFSFSLYLAFLKVRVRSYVKLSPFYGPGGLFCVVLTLWNIRHLSEILHTMQRYIFMLFFLYRSDHFMKLFYAKYARKVSLSLYYNADVKLRQWGHAIGYLRSFRIFYLLLKHWKHISNHIVNNMIFSFILVQRC